MIFKETAVFTGQVRRLFDAESYRRLQLMLAARPDAGPVIPGSGGLRKVRWPGSGRGRRGGVRVVYYWAGSDNVILLLLAYPKSDRDDLTAKQLREIAVLVKEEFE